MPVDPATQASYEAEIAAAQWRAEHPQLAATYGTPSTPMVWNGTQWVDQSSVVAQPPTPPVAPTVTPTFTEPPPGVDPYMWYLQQAGGQPPPPDVEVPVEVEEPAPVTPPPSDGGFINYDAVVREGLTGEVVDEPLVTSSPTPDAIPIPPEETEADLDIDAVEPEFGTPEYTERYYNDPGQPGYVPGSDTVVDVDEDDLDVNIVNTKTGESVTTGSLAGGYETLADNNRLLKSDLGKLDQDVQEVFKKEGYDAGVAYMETKAKQAFDDWAKDKVQLADGQWVTAEFFDSLPDDLKDVAVTLGLRALQSEIAQAKSAATVQAEVLDRQNAALTILEPFKRDGGYDTAQFLRMGGSVQVLRDADFDDNDIKEAQEYNDRPASLDGFQKEYFADRGWTMVSKAVAMLAPGRSDVREYNAHLKEANKAYIDKYGRGAVVSSVAGGTLSQLFTPAKALAPDITLKDVTALDWGVGAAQVVTMALPGIGSVAGKVGGKAAASIATKGITAAATGVFTAQTVKDWGSMTNTERAISVAFDALLIGSALPKIPIKSKLSTFNKATKVATSEATISTSEMSSVADDIRIAQESSARKAYKQAKLEADVKAAQAAKEHKQKLSDAFKDMNRALGDDEQLSVVREIKKQKLQAEEIEEALQKERQTRLDNAFKDMNKALGEDDVAKALSEQKRLKRELELAETEALKQKTAKINEAFKEMNKALGSDAASSQLGAMKRAKRLMEEDAVKAAKDHKQYLSEAFKDMNKALRSDEQASLLSKYKRLSREYDEVVGRITDTQQKKLMSSFKEMNDWLGQPEAERSLRTAKRFKYALDSADRVIKEAKKRRLQSSWNGINESLVEVSRALRRKNPKALQAAAQRLQLKAAKVPKEIGGGVLEKRAQLIAANPDDFIQLVRKQAPKDVETSIKGNENFIDNAERALRRAKNPERRKAIKEALEAAKKQKKELATQTKQQTILENMPEFPKGKYPLAKTKTTVKEIAKRGSKVIPKKNLTVIARSGKRVVIPREVFYKRSTADVARQYDVDERRLVIAISSGAINPYQPPVRISKLTDAPTPGRTPADVPYIVVSPSDVPAPSDSTKPSELPRPDTVTSPEDVTEPYPDPYPQPEPAPTPHPTPDVTVRRTVDVNRPITLPRLRSSSSGVTASSAKGLTVWEQGKLKHDGVLQTVYKYHLPSDPKGVVRTSIGKPPEGYEDYGDTPAETIQTIGGPSNVIDDYPMGAVIVDANANSRHISFSGRKHYSVVSHRKKSTKRRYDPINSVMVSAGVSP